MRADEIKNWAQNLTDARLLAKPIPQLSKSLPHFSVPEAYSIQEAGIEHRLQNKETYFGMKMGLTSEAKRKQMNLHSPLYGVLTDRMQVKESFSLKGRIHPKIEPEVAFLINKDLKGIVNREEVLNACEAVCACMEILDSRYENFQYFSLEDVIADNSSSSHFVLGPWNKNFENLDLKNLPMQMYVNGAVAQSGTSQDISGDPVVSVIQLCELLRQRNRHLPAGSVVLAGAATPAVSLSTGMLVELKVPGFSDVKVRITE